MAAGSELFALIPVSLPTLNCNDCHFEKCHEIFGFPEKISFVRIVKFGDEFSSITKLVSAFNVFLLLAKIMSVRMKSSKEV